MHLDTWFYLGFMSTTKHIFLASTTLKLKITIVKVYKIDKRRVCYDPDCCYVIYHQAKTLRSFLSDIVSLRLSSFQRDSKFEQNKIF